MRTTGARLSLVLLALAAPLALAQGQTAGPGIPDSAARAGRPGTMGAGMGHMKETMRPMMAEPGAMGMPFEHVEGRIAYMKAELMITDAQSAPWNAFADTIRADATAMKALRDGMATDGMPATMPGRLAAQHKMMSARTGMIERLETSTKALYASLSEDQRKAFDRMPAGPMGMM